MYQDKGKVYGKSFVVFGGDVQLVNSLERMLLFAGASVQADSTAYRGLAHVLNERPDTVIIEDSLTDVPMQQVIQTLQINDITKDIPVILITSQVDSTSYEKYFTAGRQDFIPKSEFDVMQVVLRIEALLRANEPVKPTNTLDISEIDKPVDNQAVKAVKLMVVEDDPLLRNLLTLKLNKVGIEHTFCNDGLAAIPSMKEYQPNIVILDLMLPGKSGLEILEEMRGLDSLKDIPVVIFSNKDDDVVKQKANDLGVTNFLVKATTDLGDLVQLISRKVKI